MALTDKQKKFADEYLIDMNATAAYLRAGYKCSEAAARSSASELLTNPNISEYIEMKQRKIEEKSNLSIQWVLNKLETLAERCMQAEPVLDREGNETGEYRFDSSGANKAIENIGRYFGMFNDKMKVDATNLNTDMTNMSPDERRARIDELNRRRGIGTANSS